MFLHSDATTLQNMANHWQIILILFLHREEEFCTKCIRFLL